MNSRMEKYYKDDSLPKRSVKNQQLYDSIYNDSDYQEVNITPKARTINIDELRQMINGNSKKVERKQLPTNFEEDEKKYDLSDAFEKARSTKVVDDRKRSISNTQYDILKNIKLKKTDSDDLSDVLNTLSTKNLVGDDLDLFENLESLDNTTVGLPTDEIIKDKTVQMDDSFFTKSMKLGPSDFETINSGIEQNSKMMKIIFILILVLIAIVFGIIVILLV